MNRSFSFFYLAGLAGALGLAAACSATSDKSTFEFDEDGDETSGEGGAGGAGGAVGAGGSTLSLSAGVGGGSPGDGFCSSPADQDGDGDGFTGAAGDCNDCDPNVNPGAIEVVVDAWPEDAGEKPAPADEDCDGLVDNTATTCDDAIKLDDFDPMNGARTLDICQEASAGDANDKKWGVLKAAYVRADGSPASPSLQVGILPSFGPNVNVQNGARMLGLSSGRARAPGDPGACNQYACSGYGDGNSPPGFPQDSPQCKGGEDINDDVGLEVTLRAPTNATGYSFNFNFYSFEYPEWVCTPYNDQFIALVSPPPAGSINGNISFDSQSNPVSVNIAYFQVCDGCPLGMSELAGTGFDAWDDAGSTSWLKTSAPVKGGDEVTIRWTIWDTADTAWDSTALIDNFQWIANGGTVTIGTEPIPDPK